jgi:hypothetical protein
MFIRVYLSAIALATADPWLKFFTLLWRFSRLILFAFE